MKNDFVEVELSKCKNKETTMMNTIQELNPSRLFTI